MEKPRYPPPSIPLFCVGAAPLVVSGFFYLHTKSISNAISVAAAGIVTGVLHWLVCVLDMMIIYIKICNIQELV